MALLRHLFWNTIGNTMGTQFFFVFPNKKTPLCVKKENGGNGRKKSRCLLEKFNSDAITTCFCFTDFS